jgi:hypothetical protein
MSTDPVTFSSSTKEAGSAIIVPAETTRPRRSRDVILGAASKDRTRGIQKLRPKVAAIRANQPTLQICFKVVHTDIFFFVHQKENRFDCLVSPR